MTTPSSDSPTSSASSPLQDLLAVQDLDTWLDQARHRQAHLPERSELAAIDGQIAAAAAQLGQLEGTLSTLRERQGAAEAELAATEERSAGISRRMYGGTVSAARDLQAMADEIEHLKVRASALEDAVLEVLDELEPLEEQAGELRSTTARLEGERTMVVSRLETAEAAIGVELADLESRRAAGAGAVPEALLATYERLRARLGGVGVARLVGTHCDGCHLTLSAVELDRVRHLPDGEVYTCEQCGRILVP
jgi:uncharacterized protein